MQSRSARKKYALFIGRYQTLHEGHKYIFRKKIQEGKPVLVAVREVEPDEKNPYSLPEVMTMFHGDTEIASWMARGMFAIITIPDIEGVYYGRDVGYNVEKIEVPESIALISATTIREEKKKSGLL